MQKWANTRGLEISPDDSWLKHCTWLEMLDFEQPRAGDSPMQIATYAELVPLSCIVLNVLSHTSSLRRCRVPEFSGSRQDLLQLHIWWPIGWWLQNGMVADLLKKTKMCGSWMFLVFLAANYRISCPNPAADCFVVLGHAAYHTAQKKVMCSLGLWAFCLQ